MSPFPTIVLSLLCVIAFLPGESAIKLLISSLKPGNHFTRGSSSVMMISINPDKAPVKSALSFFSLLLFVLNCIFVCQCVCVIGKRDAPSVIFFPSLHNIQHGFRREAGEWD